MASQYELLAPRFRSLWANLTPDKLRTTSAELHRLSPEHGPDFAVMLFRCLLEDVAAHPSDTLLLALLHQELHGIASDAAFASVLCRAFGAPPLFLDGSLAAFSRALKLSLQHEITLATAWLSSENPEQHKQAMAYFKARIVELLPTLAEVGLSKTVLHRLLFLLSNSKEFLGIEQKPEFRILAMSLADADRTSTLTPLVNRDADFSFNSARSFAKERELGPSASGAASTLAARSSRAIQVSKLIEDTGYPATADVATLKAIFARTPITQDLDLVSVISTLCRPRAGVDSASGIHLNASGSLVNTPPPSDPESGPSQWNIDVFTSVLKELYQPILKGKWWMMLDSPVFYIEDQKGFVMFMNIFRRLSEAPFPLELLFKKWQSVASQISFLRFAILSPPELFSFNTAPRRLPNLDSTLTTMAKQPIIHAWTSLDLVDILIELDSAETHILVRSLFDLALKHCPDLLLLCFASLPEHSKKPIVQEIMVYVLTVYLSGNQIPGPSVHRAWQTNKVIIINAMADVYHREPNTLSRILDVAQDLKALTVILDSSLYSFTIDLACLASRREFLNLEKWLRDKVGPIVDDAPLSPPVSEFLNECIAFLRDRFSRQFKGDNVRIAHPNPYQSTVAAFISVIQSLAQFMTPDQATELKKIKMLYQQLFSGKPEDHVAMDVLRTAPGMPGAEPTPSFTQDVESSANTFFKDIYAGSMSIEQVIQTLTHLHDSANKHENNIYNCIIHNLFDEHRFFPKYPEKELRITATLYGQLINCNLISQYQTNFALNIILDSLKKQPNTKIYKFGIQALEQFKLRLSDFPVFVSSLLQILNTTQNSEIHEMIPNLGRQTPLPPTASVVPAGMMRPEDQSVPVNPPAVNPQASSNASKMAAKDPSIISSLNANPLLQAASQVLQPPDELRDKIHFVWNNLSQTNLEAKAQQLREILDPRYYPAVAQYIVINRVSMEANFHKIYLGFLDILNISVLNKLILQNTIDSIRVLLSSDVKVGSMEKSLLKNLGSWLGSITLAKNKPILHKNIALKELVLDAYERGRLTSVIPFICKVLEASSRSKVFKYQNPWIMGLLRLLVEIHAITDIKLHIKFEVEMLFRSLAIEIRDIVPSELCKDRKLKIDGENGDWSKQPEQKVQSTVPVVDMGRPGEPINLQALLNQIQSSFPFPSSPSTPDAKRIVHTAITRVLQEMMAPVVDRSASIACITTKELVCKDFASEPDEVKMRKAAFNMAQSLAGNLALVACKDPLRTQLSSYIRQLLQQDRLLLSIVPADRLQHFIESTTQVWTAENLDLAANIIEKAAMDKAGKDIDDRLNQFYVIRKRHREMTDSPYYDSNVIVQGRYPLLLPEILRPRQVGLAPAQLRIYDDYTRLRNLRPQQEEVAVVPGMGPSSTSVANLLASLGELDTIMASINPETVSNLPPDHSYYRVMRAFLSMLNQTQPIEEATQTVVMKIFKRLYELENRFQVDTYIFILEQIQKAGRKPDLTQFFIKMEDERKLHLGILSTLSRLQYLNVAEICQYLVKVVMSSGSVDHAEFAMAFVRKCLIEDQTASIQDVAPIVEALTPLRKTNSKIQERIARFLEEIRIFQNSDDRNRLARLLTRLSQVDEMIDSQADYDESVALFNEWLAALAQPQAEVAITSFINQPRLAAVVKGDEPGNPFFRCVARYCVELFQSPTTANTQAIDGFAKLVVQLVRSNNDPTGPIAKVDLLSRVLDSVIIVLARDHETRKTRFNQRPYLRLFSTWLNDFNQPDSLLDPINFQFLVRFSTAFQSISPLRFPGFSFAWLELISHRMFMPKLLFSKSQKGWSYFQHLLVDLFKFLEPFLRSADLKDPIKLLYTGTLRTLLVLLHDFPEFLCDYHFSFCDVIPPTCVQMRNLILAAFPRNIRLPDPFTPNLKVDLLPEISHPPRVLSSYATALTQANLKSDLDNYLKTRQPQTFPMELRARLSVQTPGRTTPQYNVPLINAVVLHVGMQVVSQQPKSPLNSPLAHSASMDIFQHLAVSLDTEGRYLFLNAIANQLRYPNNHTHYFSCILLYVFAEANDDIIKEQITRVLLERLVVSRPHPWGLMITFIELIKNTRYNFWNHGFTRCAPEIERLFESVSQHSVIPSQSGAVVQAPSIVNGTANAAMTQGIGNQSASA